MFRYSLFRTILIIRDVLISFIRFIFNSMQVKLSTNVFARNMYLSEGERSRANRRIPLVQQNHRTNRRRLLLFRPSVKSFLDSSRSSRTAMDEKKMAEGFGVPTEVPEIGSLSTFSIYYVRGRSVSAFENCSAAFFSPSLLITYSFSPAQGS